MNNEPADVVAQHFAGGHRHDWRVDPSQVIITARDGARVRVACADCPLTATATTPVRTSAVPGKPKTWRQYRYTHGDTLRIDLLE